MYVLKKKKKKSLTAKTQTIGERVRGMSPIGDCIFWVSNLRFSFPTGVQKVIPSTLALEMADPQNNAVRQEGS